MYPSLAHLSSSHWVFIVVSVYVILQMLRWNAEVKMIVIICNNGHFYLSTAYDSNWILRLNNWTLKSS